MKLAIIGSRSLCDVDISGYISEPPDEIVSGGAVGVDTCAREYAKKEGIRLVEFLPEYSRFGRGATIVRNKKIVEYSDSILAIWDGVSSGTLSALRYAKRLGKPCRIIIIN